MKLKTNHGTPTLYIYFLEKKTAVDRSCNFFILLTKILHDVLVTSVIFAGQALQVEYTRPFKGSHEEGN